MSKYNTLTAVSFFLLLGVIMGTAAQSQGLPPPFISWAAKFVCGPITFDSDVVSGQYRTAINIHNPQSTITVRFLKKFVLARPEGQIPRPPVIRQDSLGPDLADFVHCPIILAALDLPGGSHAEGFVVIEVAAPATGPAPLLDVVGKYTARAPNGFVSTIDIETIPAKRITQ